MLNKSPRVLLISVSAIILIYYLGFELPFRGRPFNKQRHGNPPLIHAWAPECWLREDDSNTSEDLTDILKISLDGLHKPHILNINMSSAPKKVELDGRALSDTLDFPFDTARNKLIIKTDIYQSGKYVILKW